LAWQLAGSIIIAIISSSPCASKLGRAAADALLCRAAVGCMQRREQEAHRNEQHGRVDLTVQTATGKQAAHHELCFFSTGVVYSYVPQLRVLAYYSLTCACARASLTAKIRCG